MTVKELIEKLSKMPQSATVITNYHSDWWEYKDEPCEIRGRRRIGQDTISVSPDSGDAWLQQWERDTDSVGPTETFVSL